MGTRQYGKDVIIIDDEPDVVSTLKMYCEEMDCFRNIICAREGSEASKKLTNQKFCLILLDINMPRKSGVHIVKEMADKKHINSNDAVLIISGELNKEVLSESIKKGAKTFMVKPFTQEQFEAKVRSILITTAPQLIGHNI